MVLQHMFLQAGFTVHKPTCVHVFSGQTEKKWSYNMFLPETGGLSSWFNCSYNYVCWTNLIVV